MDVKNKILVTGGTGMIGQYVIKNLLKRKYKVVVLTRKVKKDIKGIEYVCGDITDGQSLKGIMSGVVAIIHLAACLDLSKSFDVFYRVNVEGSRNIFDLAFKNKVRLIINISSAMVFGGLSSKTKTEKTKLRTGEMDNYIKTKIENLSLVEKYRKKGINIINVYPTAVIDINKKPELNGGFLTKFIWKLWGGIPGALSCSIGSGKRMMNYIFVEEVAEGIVLAMEKGRYNGDYILGGENIQVKDFLKKMAFLYKKRYLPIRIPYFLVKTIWKQKPEDNCFSNKKAHDELFNRIS